MSLRARLTEVRVPSEDEVRSPLRDAAVAARVGLWLGGCFVVAFLTGLYSHALQNPPEWFTPVTRPVWTYRMSQGLHYLAGTACVPLLLVKLYAVYPRLFARPPRVRRDLLPHLLERGSVALLVASAIFQVATGTANAVQWYPWSFSFRSTHYALAWVTVGALAIHVAVKLPVIRAALTATLDDSAANGEHLSRRGLLRATYAAAALLVVGVAGSSVPWLRHVSVFANHDTSRGVPINKTARRAGVTAAATDPDWTLEVVGPAGTVYLRLPDLAAMTQRTAELPIACVEGWSASGTWTGVRLRDVLDRVAAPVASSVRVESLQQEGPFRSSELSGAVANDPLTLLALGLDGQGLALDHGFPCRLISPGPPGVHQTKWLSRVEVLR
jgi:Oxidoreductase molybdopterin binding domain